MVLTLLAETAPGAPELGTRIVTLIIVALVAVPLVAWLRRRVSDARRERYLREDLEQGRLPPSSSQPHAGSAPPPGSGSAGSGPARPESGSAPPSPQSGPEDLPPQSSSER